MNFPELLLNFVDVLPYFCHLTKIYFNTIFDSK